MAPPDSCRSRSADAVVSERVMRLLVLAFQSARHGAREPVLRGPGLRRGTGRAARTAIFVFVLACSPTWATDTALVPLGSTWKYLDDGSDPGAQWAGLAFDDTAWRSGPAQLGYGDGDEATVVGFGGDPNRKYITTYFRRAFAVADPAKAAQLHVRLLRDDGAVVYLNGRELFRSNLPGGLITAATLATAVVAGAAEMTLVEGDVDARALRAGTNVVAVEAHQANTTSSDISFDLELTEVTRTVHVTRGPYLQLGTPTGIVVRWRTDVASDSRVRYGANPGELTRVVDLTTSAIEHEVQLIDLAPDATYYYAIGTTTDQLAGGDADHRFVTSPVPGRAKDMRLWVLGDSGYGDANARAVRDAFDAFTATYSTDLWLMLGDNAYSSGTDAEYQLAVFETYPQRLAATVLWPTLGNHDAISSHAATQQGPYYDAFTLPTAGEAGGTPSGTEAYYSFDHANVHFVCLDSSGSDRSSQGAMLTWLRSDLAAVAADWTIAFWHHPPYSKGSHDSDVEVELREMRENALPILEEHGVDVVLCGHSHAYERSQLLDGHYGHSSTLTATMLVDPGDGRLNGDGAYHKPGSGPVPHQGTVYVVTGTGSQVRGGSLNHPAMPFTLNKLGSVVLDIRDNVLDSMFIDDEGVIRDAFRIVKDAATPTATPTKTPTITPPATSAPTATLTAHPCVGDCDGRRMVTVEELVVGVGIALATLTLSDCPTFDADNDGRVSVHELVLAVNNALVGCDVRALR